MVRAAALLILVLCFPAHADVLPKGYDIIVVAGQSNSEDSGLGEFVDPAATAWVDARIKQLGRFGGDDHKVVDVGCLGVNGYKYACLQHWQMIDAPAYRMGHAYTFARHYVRHRLGKKRTLLIVPGGFSGSSILWWSNKDSLRLWPDLKERVQFALNLPGHNRVVAVLWDQGETDANYVSDNNRFKMTRANYKERLHHLFWQFRRYFRSNPKNPFPIITGRFVPAWAPGGSFHAKWMIESAIRDVLKEDVNAAWVPSTGLVSNAAYDSSDTVHFSASSNIIRGNRAWSAFREMERE